MHIPRPLFASSFLLLSLALFAGAPSARAGEVELRWPEGVERVWAGPELWANRLQDWRVRGGRLECVFPGENRNVHLLTADVGDGTGALQVNVRLGLVAREGQDPSKAWAGFEIGARGEFDDYRDSAVRGSGIEAGVTFDGRLFMRDPRTGWEIWTPDETAKPLPPEVELHLNVSAENHISLVVIDPAGLDPAGKLFNHLNFSVNPANLPGNVALICHGEGLKTEADEVVAWFDDWTVSGERVVEHPERAFGPVLFNQYTLSRGVLKMTAQLPPIGERDRQTVRLELLGEDDAWRVADEAKIDPLARTATFRVEGWDGSNFVPYRIAYDLVGSGGSAQTHHYPGTIRREPLEKDTFVLAAFTGNNDLGFPHHEIVEAVLAHDPDMLFFSGDQIYEAVGGFGCQRSPLDKASLAYLRKWYLYGWAHGELMREIPTVAIPDDHDVFHGNIWGCAGKATVREGSGMVQQDSGGYKMPAEWVRMVERTQTAHLPDPFDPTPVEQGIGVYYCGIDYAGISFAVLEDRKFKSAPAALLPEGKIVNGWSQNPEWNAAESGDVPGAVLLGERQLDFLEEWAADWSHGARMKVVLSQTIFANVATLPGGEDSDGGVPRLPIPEPGGYPEGDQPVQDLDSNGWPQTGRNRALLAMRKGFALHVAGDQHLGSTIQYGIDAFGDAPFALCVPSVSNVWPRRWFPSEGGANRLAGAPRYTGEFIDGFGNRMTVRAIGNPVVSGRQPARLYDRANGYGIVRLNRKTREITLENWARGVDPTAPDARPCPGWPVQLTQLENYGRTPLGYLPELVVTGLVEPVVQFVHQSSGEVEYTLRLPGARFRPMVFREGKHTIRVGDPDLGPWREVRDVERSAGSDDQLLIEF